ncbi:MAG: SoxR reducing system RseC family protein [Cyclobacteriaceae bacterium]
MAQYNVSDIIHSGFVSEVANGRVKVSLFRPEACGGCQMKDYCGGDNDERQEFEVAANGYQVGDEVQLLMSTSTGLRAVLVAYLVPFAVLLLSLIAGLEMGLTEAEAALVSLSTTGLYYILLKMMSGSIKNHFSINIQKLQTHE